MSTGDLSANAEHSVEIDSSPDRSTCFSADPDGVIAETGMDHEFGGTMDSDSENGALSNLEEEDHDANDDVDSQASVDLEYVNEDKKGRSESKRKLTRFV